MPKLKIAVSIQHDIGAQRDPVTKKYHRRNTVLLVDSSDVEVTIDKGFNIRMRHMILPREVQQALGGTVRNGP